MKKQYIRPQMAVIAIGTCAILAASGEQKELPYGGVRYEDEDAE